MIENIFGIVNVSKNYFLTLQQFDFAIKHVLDTKYGIEPSLLEIRIDYIQDEIVLVFNEESRNDIFRKLIGDAFSFNNVKKAKTKLLRDIFGDNFIFEKVVYNKLFNSRVDGITFTVKDNEKYNEFEIQNMDILDCPQIEKLNAQIRVLNEKKISIIRNNKR